MKAFISQPMNGLPEEEIRETRAEAIRFLDTRYPGIEIIDSYFEDYEPSTGNIALKYLSKSLELLADADVVYFCKGWKKARGCRIESACAYEYGIKELYGADE